MNMETNEMIIKKTQIVDLGLPSGILWADRNVGAEKPEGHGYYFRFAETIPCSDDESNYHYENFRTDIAGSHRDAATVFIGKEFRMPTFDQYKELLENCNYDWTDLNGIIGICVTGPNNNRIFLPAAGYKSYSCGNIFDVGFRGSYWSADQLHKNVGKDFCFDLDGWRCWNDNKSFGLSIRAVKINKVSPDVKRLSCD